MKLRILGLLPCLALLACAEQGGDPTSAWTVERLYEEAQGAKQAGNYERAKEYYRALETRSLTGVYGQQALLDLAYVYYKSDEPERAVETCDRFIKLYPQHAHVDYAYYLRGLANFYSDPGLAGRFMPLDRSQRDPTRHLKVFEDFSTLLRKYPDSKYADDTRQRMVYLRNLAAAHEVEVASYYMRRDAYIAAANRARYVVENYPRTTAVPDALATMARAYTALEMRDLAAAAERVLQLNYPDHPALADLSRIRLR